MQPILFACLPVIIAVVVVVRRRSEHRRAALAKALRYETRKAERERIPTVSSNLCGSTVEPTPTPTHGRAA